MQAAGMDRVNLLKTFARVAETRSFTKAGASLGVSRATVSGAIRELEEHLGARLLHRTTRSVNLTPEGRLYYEHAQEILARLELSDQLFAARTPRISGRLSIDVPTRIARRVIIPALPTLLAQHPKLEVHLGASDRAINLVEHGVDAVVRVGPREDSSFIVQPLGSLAQVNCASPRYLASFGQPTRLEDLARHRAVSYGQPRLGGTTWEYLDGDTERSVPIPCAVSVDNAETYIAAGLAGLGMIQIPAYDVHHHFESGALVEVLSQHVPAPLPIALLYPSRRQVPARLRIFADWLLTLFTQREMLSAPPRVQPRRSAAQRRVKRG